MIIEILRYQVPSDQRNAFLEAYENALDLVRQSPHCQGAEWFEASNDPNRHLFVLRWDSAEGHLKGFRSSDLFPEFLALVRPFIPSMVEMEHYEDRSALGRG